MKPLVENKDDAPGSGAANSDVREEPDPAMVNQKRKVHRLGCGAAGAAYCGLKRMQDLFAQKK